LQKKTVLLRLLERKQTGLGETNILFRRTEQAKHGLIHENFDDDDLYL
jgi:hypothetical protein